MITGLFARTALVATRNTFDRTEAGKCSAKIAVTAKASKPPRGRDQASLFTFSSSTYDYPYFTEKR